jgi:hypothetical protein
MMMMMMRKKIETGESSGQQLTRKGIQFALEFSIKHQKLSKSTQFSNVFLMFPKFNDTFPQTSLPQSFFKNSANYECNQLSLSFHFA